MLTNTLLNCESKHFNGSFSGQTHLYADHSTFAQFADALRNFPSGGSDIRLFEVGSFEVSVAGGGAWFRCFCSDTTGHAIAEVILRSDPNTNGGLSDCAMIYVPIEACRRFIYQTT